MMMRMRYTVQMADLMHCMTRFRTGDSRCVQKSTISTKTMRMVKMAKAKLIAALALHRSLSARCFSSLTFPHAALT